jgi:hypothetical protein
VLPRGSDEALAGVAGPVARPYLLLLLGHDARVGRRCLDGAAAAGRVPGSGRDAERARRALERCYVRRKLGVWTALP